MEGENEQEDQAYSDSDDSQFDQFGQIEGYTFNEEEEEFELSSDVKIEEKKEEKKEEKEIKYSLEDYKSIYNYWCASASFFQNINKSDEYIRIHLKRGGVMQDEIDWFFSKTELARELHRKYRDFDFIEGKVFKENWKYEDPLVYTDIIPT